MLLNENYFLRWKQCFIYWSHLVKESEKDEGWFLQWCSVLSACAESLVTLTWHNEGELKKHYTSHLLILWFEVAKWNTSGMPHAFSPFLCTPDQTWTSWPDFLDLVDSWWIDLSRGLCFVWVLELALLFWDKQCCSLLSAALCFVTDSAKNGFDSVRSPNVLKQYSIPKSLFLSMLLS